MTNADELPADVAASAVKQIGAIVKASLAPVVKELSGVKKQLASIQTEKTNAKRDEYRDKLKELGNAGLDGKECQRLNAQGEKYDWDMSLLANAEHHPTVDLGSITKRFRNGSAPEVPGTNGRATDEEIAEELKRRGKDPKKMPAFTR